MLLAEVLDQSILTQGCRYKGLSRDEALVFDAIVNAGATGIWNKHIKTRVGVHVKIVDNATKSLKSRGLIKLVTEAKNSARKVWIEAHLEPSEETTGGTWYNNGELDEGLIFFCKVMVLKEVSQETWVEVETEDLVVDPFTTSKKRREPDSGFDAGVTGKGKAPRLIADTAKSSSIHADSEARSSPEASRKHHKTIKSYEPRSSRSHKLPGLDWIVNKLNSNKASIKDPLPKPAIQQLLDCMVYDDTLVKIEPEQSDLSKPPPLNFETFYRTVEAPDRINAYIKRNALAAGGDSDAVRATEMEDLGRGGLTEVPCGRCPVFDLCAEGGPVNPSNCEYFDDWLRGSNNTRYKTPEQIF